VIAALGLGAVLTPLAFPGATDTAAFQTYYNGKKDHHKRVTTERPHPTGGSCPREGHGRGKLIRILFSVYFGGFRGWSLIARELRLAVAGPNRL